MRLAMRALPWITGGMGALPGLQEGNLVKAITGGGLGAWGGSSLRGPIGGITRTAMRQTPGAVSGLTGLISNRMPNTVLGNRLGSALLDSPMLAKNALGIPGAVGAVKNILPWAGVAGAIPLTGGLSGMTGSAVDRTGGIASSQLSGRGDPNSGDVLGSQNLPPGTIDRMVGPQGNYWYRLDPAGVPFGDRLGRQLDARANSNVMNILGDTGFAQTERVEKADLARQAAAKQLKENIEMAREMSQQSQVSGLNMAEATNKAVAQAMLTRNNFNYFN